MRSAVIFCVLAALAVAASLIADIVTMPVLARTADFHVVVDAGHGGKDGGAQSRNGTKESDINLAIAKYLAEELKSRGAGVTMTREGPDSLAGPFSSNKKRDDMEKRRQLIEKIKPDLVISIHLNSFPSHPGVRGLQTFYSKESQTSKKYADAIQIRFNESTLSINRRAAVGSYYILDCTPFPSVLVECGFLSNPDEEKMLKTREYQKILAQHMAQAVTNA